LCYGSYTLLGWPSVPTFRKWAWYFVERISGLKDDIIRIENRFEGLGDVVYTNCFMSSDCVDCPCFESWPWTKRMFSKKMNGPGIKYKVGVCIKTGHIVWVNGSFVASTSEGTIFNEGLGEHIYPDEKVEVDSGPKGDDRLVQPHVVNPVYGKTRVKSNSTRLPKRKLASKKICWAHSYILYIRVI
jgi:hypothetical protein